MGLVFDSKERKIVSIYQSYLPLLLFYLGLDPPEANSIPCVNFASTSKSRKNRKGLGGSGIRTYDLAKNGRLIPKAPGVIPLHHSPNTYIITLANDVYLKKLRFLPYLA